MAMMATTTSNSINVNPRAFLFMAQIIARAPIPCFRRIAFHWRRVAGGIKKERGESFMPGYQINWRRIASEGK
jgi:hypothetical protein